MDGASPFIVVIVDIQRQAASPGTSYYFTQSANPFRLFFWIVAQPENLHKIRFVQFFIKVFADKEAPGKDLNNESGKDESKN